jgi:hypothetical protein
VKADSHIDLLAALLIGAPDLTVLQDREAWETIKQQASSYGVGPLIAYAARPHVPATERAWCDQTLVQSWQRHSRMLGQLESALEVLAGAGIRAIALKGPLLAQRYYEPAFLRKPSLDLDFAIAEPDIERAAAALLREGYSLDWPLAYARAHSHHVELSHPSRPHLELHFRLTHRALGIPVEEFFERALLRKLSGGKEALVLGPADQLLHLVLHLAQSRFGTLFHLLEIHRAWNAEPVEARIEAVQRGVAHGYCGAFQMMDVAFRVRWGTPLVPAGEKLPHTWLQSRLTPALYRQFEQWSIPGRGLSVAERTHARWLDFQLTDSPAAAARLALFFLKTAWFSAGSRRLWGTPKHLRFAPATAQADFSQTRRDR